MTTILPRELDPAVSVPADAALIIDNGVTVEKATPEQVTQADTSLLRVPQGEDAPPVDSLNGAEGKILAVITGRIKPIQNDVAGAEQAMETAVAAAAQADADRIAAQTARNESEVFHDQSEIYRNQSLVFRDDSALAATIAQAAKDEAALSASQASLARLLADAYPNAAATNVPRGLTQASVGAITAGSGGTNGTFALTWTGGNFTINPTGTFTVAGGVLTAVTITGPGLYIGASPTVPTPGFAASAGLTGANVALTAQFLVTSGQGYWVVSADTYYLLPYQNVSGTATAVAGGQPIATGPYVDSMPGTNINPDPFFTRIDDYEYVGQYRSYFGTLTRNDTDSAALGYFGNTLSATGSGLVSRYILLSDLGLLPGDVVTIGIHATTSALITVALQFSNAARGVIGGYGATTTLTAGTGIRYLTATVPPSGAVHLQVGLSNSATKKLFAFVVAKGPFKPAFVPPRPPAVNALPENLYYDTCNQLISNNGKQLGKVPYVSTIDGNPLMGLLNIDPGGTGLSLVAAPAQSPFKTPAIRLPASSNGHDLFVEVSRLGLRVGDTLHIVFGYVATQIMTNAVRLTNAAGTLVGTEIQRSADVRDPSNAIGYGEVTIEMPVTQTILDGIPTKMRLRMESPIGAAGAFLIGVSIAKQKHSLRDIMGSVRGADIVARSAAPARTIGRYAVILSDSIFGTAIKTQDNPDTYPYMVFSERLGMKVTHTGLGGTTAARRGDDANYDALSMSAIGGYIRTGNFAPMIAAAAALANSEVILKVAELAAVDWTQVGEIFCAYGTNDWAAVPTPLGTINDMTGNTFYGAYNLFLQDVLTKYPQIRVRLVTAKYCDRFTLNGYGLGSINGTVMTITSAIYAGYTVGDTVYQEGVKERAYIVPGGTGTGGVGTYNLSKNLGVTPVPGLYVGDIISSANDNLNSDVYANAAGNTLLTLNAAINAIGTKHHLKVLPFAEQCGINRYTIHRNSPDGFHLSQLYGFDEGVGFAAVLWGQA